MYEKNKKLINWVELWTMSAIILHFCRIGDFAEWPVIAWPWHWSCFCICIWSRIVALAIYIFACFMSNKDR